MFRLCECGCGEEVKSIKRKVCFIKGHYCRGKHPTEQSKEKNRQAHLGRPSPRKGKTGIYSEETLQKIKDARARQVMKAGRTYSEESKEKNRQAHLGKAQTQEARDRKSIALTGKPKSMEHRVSIAKSKAGENNPRWLGGISKLPYTQDWTEDLKDAIRKRDHYTCQLCGISHAELYERHQRKLTVHHIDYNKDNCDPINLISLCVSCHAKAVHRREAWKVFFSQRVEVADSSITAFAN